VHRQAGSTAAPPPRNLPALTYHVLVGVCGWALLAYLATMGGTLREWLDVAAFALLAIGVKSLGFRVVPNVTHSLVGVVDLAALFSLGPLGGVVVAFVSSTVCRLASSGSGPAWGFPNRWQPVIFVGGLNVIKIATAGWAYRVAGGAVPLAVDAWQSLWPVLAASVVSFAVDHLLWAVSTVLLEGRAGLMRFLHGIMPYSVFVEFLPLPLSAVISATWQASAPLFLLLGVTILSVGYVLQSLVVSLSRERRHVREHQTITELGQGLLSAQLDVRTLCELVYRSAARMVPAPVFALQLAESEGGEAVAVCSAPHLEMRLADGSLGRDTYRAVAESRRSLVVPDFRLSSLQPLRLGPPARSGLYVPIIRGEEMFGVISLQSPERDAFSPEDREAIELLASQAAMGMETTRLYQQERQRAAQLLAISEVTRKVAAIQGLPGLFADTARLVADTFHYYHVSILTVDPEARAIRFQAASSPIVQERGMQIPWGEGLIGFAARTAETVLVNDVSQDRRFRTDAALSETRSEMCVPLVVEDRIVGVLDVQSNQAGAFGESDRFVLETLGAQIAIAIEDNRLYQAQQEQAWVSTALQQAAEAVVANPAAPEDVLDAVARLTLMLAGVDRCAIFVWLEEENAHTAIASEGWGQAQTAALRGAVFPAGSIPILERLRSEGQVVRSVSEELLAFLPPALRRDAPRGLLIGLPLRTKGEYVGAMLVEEFDGREPPDEHRMTILTGIANHAALGLDNARLYASQREEAWVSTALLQVANSITTTLDLPEAVGTVARLVPMLVGVRWCAVLLWDEERRAITARHGYGLAPEALDALLADAPQGIERLLDGDEPRIEGDVAAAGWLPTEVAGDVACCAGAAFPMRARAKRLGLLVAGESPTEGFSGRAISILSGIASQAAMAVEAAQLYEQTLFQQRLEREIELARDIQTTFLPDAIPALEGWRVAIEWRAARGVGGDYYDFIPLEEGRWGFIIADVSDKGVGAALYMALSRAVVRAAALDARGPAETLERANRVLVGDNRSGMFVSLFYAVLDPCSGTLCYARAGHNPPLWLRAERGEMQPLCPPGVVLGITEDAGIGEETVVLAPRDAVVMYTDGVIDAVDDANREFGEERLGALLQTRVGEPAESLVGEIDRAVRRFVGGREQFDDFTLLVLSRE
jgi:sigma-B regulation protein RsbU (phosphoserine phosphatase)